MEREREREIDRASEIEIEKYWGKAFVIFPGSSSADRVTAPRIGPINSASTTQREWSSGGPELEPSIL